MTVDVFDTSYGTYTIHNVLINLRNNDLDHVAEMIEIMLPDHKKMQEVRRMDDYLQAEREDRLLEIFATGSTQ